MKLLPLVIAAFTIGSSVFAEKARFDNYKVYTIQVENEKQLNTLQELEGTPDGVSN